MYVPPNHLLSALLRTQVDHFTYTNQDTYEMRYMVADQYWDHDGGPILFYTGNENTIELFINITVCIRIIAFFLEISWCAGHVSCQCRESERSGLNWA